MRVRPIAARLGLVVASLLLIASCGSSDDEPEVPSHLLQPDDVTGVEKVEVKQGQSVSKTVCGAMDMEWNVAVVEDDPTWVRYSLGGEDSIVSTTQGPATLEPTVDRTIERVDEGIDECVERDAQDPSDRTRFERIDGLPAGAVGFRSVSRTSNGLHTTERAYGRVSDEEVAVVTVIHFGDGEMPAQVTDLLPRALERATAP